MTYITILTKINKGSFRDEIIEALTIQEDGINEMISDLLYEDMDNKQVDEINKWLNKEENIQAELLEVLMSRFFNEFIDQSNDIADYFILENEKLLEATHKAMELLKDKQ